jgi:tetratricopeptide (TPR) repeat protein
MVLEGRLRFPEACARFSENEFIIRASGLLPVWVRRDRAVPWIGNQKEFHDVVFALSPGELSEVFETAQGYMVARVEDVQEPRVRPFEEVERDVRERIARDRSTEALPRLLEELKERYRVKLFEPPGRSAEELFAAARSAADPRRRVELYQEIVERFPEDERALEAQFMVGFVRAEELGDREGAREAFQRVIEMDPDSELARSAQWMLSSGGGELPSFEGEDPGRGNPEPEEERP